MLRPHHATAHYGVRYSWQRGAPAFRSVGDDLLRAAAEKAAERATADCSAAEAAKWAATVRAAVAVAEAAAAEGAVVAAVRTAAKGKLALVTGPAPLPTVSAAAIEVATAAAAAWANVWKRVKMTVWKQGNCWANRRHLLPCRPLSPTSLLTHARRRPPPSQTHRLAGYS